MLSLIVEMNSRLKLANCLFLPLNSTLAQGQAYGHRGSRQLWRVRQISFEIVESHWDITPFLSLLILLAFCLGAVSSLLQHILFQILLPQVEARVTVTGEIAPGVSLETSPQWI